jgi:Tfp pilus assembly protein PilF
MDPIVRVQARNLRARLAQYYAGPGANDPVLIDLPKRTYVPTFQLLQPAPAPLPAAAVSLAPGPEAAAAPTLAPDPMPSSQPQQAGKGAAPVLSAIIAVAILSGVLIWQSHLGKTSAKAPHQPDPQAQDLYIRGRYLIDRQTESALREGMKCFEEAVVRDPQFAAAYAGLADSYNVLAQYGYVAPPEGMEKARHAAEKALDIEPALAEAHVSLAAVLEAYDWNWQGAEREYRRSIELNPALASAHLWYGMFLRDQGRLGEALPELRRAAQLEPYSALTNVNLAHGLLMVGDSPMALEAARHAVEIAPEMISAQVLLAKAHEAQSQKADAEAVLTHARQFTSGNPHGLALLARTYARGGRPDEGRRMFQELENLAHQRYVSPFDLGTVSLALGDEDRALEFLQEAYKQRSSGLIFLRDASFAKMHRADGFQRLIEQMHFKS